MLRPEIVAALQELVRIPSQTGARGIGTGGGSAFDARPRPRGRRLGTGRRGAGAACGVRHPRRRISPAARMSWESVEVRDADAP